MKTRYVSDVYELKEIIEDMLVITAHDEDYSGRVFQYIHEIIGLKNLSLAIDMGEEDIEDFMGELDEFDSYQTGLDCYFYLGNNGEDRRAVEVFYDILYISGHFVLRNFRFMEV